MVKTTRFASSVVVMGLGELLLLVTFTHSALEPAATPGTKNRSFSIFWAAPTRQCQHFFNVDLNLQSFNTVANPLELRVDQQLPCFIHMNQGIILISLKMENPLMQGCCRTGGFLSTIGKPLLMLENLSVGGDLRLLL